MTLEKKADMDRRKFVRLTTGGVAFALAGCVTQTSSNSSPQNSGGGGGDGGSGGQGKIPVGSLFPLTGFWSPNGRAIRDAIQFTVEEINAAGGPLGRKIQHIASDNEGADAQVAVQKMNKMISSDNIVGHIGPTSGTLPAVREIVENNKIVSVSPAAGTHSLWRSGPPWWWRTVADDTIETYAVVKAVLEGGAGSQKPDDISAAIVGVENQSSQSINDQIETIAEERGLKITTTVVGPTGQSDISSTAKKALETNPDRVILTGETTQVPSILKTMLQNGYKSEDAFITSEARSPEIFKQVSDPNIVEGAKALSAAADGESERYKTFADNLLSKTDASEVHAFAPTSYDATNTLALAIHAAGSTKGKQIANNMRPISIPPGKKVSTFEEGRDALEAGEKINYQGAVGPVNFDKYGNCSGSFAVYTATKSKWKQTSFIGPKEIRQFRKEGNVPQS